MANIVRAPCDEGVIRTAATPQPCPKSAGNWILAATILASSMAFIDSTSTNLALPALQHDLNASAIDLQWVVQAYALFLSALILVGGALGDRYGRKRVFLIGVVVFAGASVWCGVAPTIEQLIFARALQGIGAALLVPGSLAIISAAFPEEERGKAIGTWSGFSALTTALGPVVGGWLVENLSWRWVFYTNIPLAIGVVVLTVLFVPESRDEEATGRLDLPGAILATLGLGGVVYGLTESASRGLGDPLIIATLGGGIVMLVLFLVVESRVQHPIMPLTLFRSSTFSGANLLTLFLYMALGGSLYFLPLNLIQVQGYTATAAGLALLPFVITMFILSRWSGGLVARYGAKRPLVIGPCIAAVGYLLFSFTGTDGSYWTSFFPAIMMLSLGMAISVAPLTTTVMNAVESSHSGVASGINNAVARSAGLLAVAIMGVLMYLSFNATLDTAIAPLDLAPTTQATLDVERSKLAGAELPTTLDPQTTATLEQAIADSFVAGYRVVMYLAIALALASALSAALFIEGRPQTLADLEQHPLETEQTEAFSS